MSIETMATRPPLSQMLIITSFIVVTVELLYLLYLNISEYKKDELSRAAIIEKEYNEGIRRRVSNETTMRLLGEVDGCKLWQVKTTNAHYGYITICK